ncbi:unnamed protein product [Parascedosporium putredinis]|uniref:V-type proton ATPase subunit e n=1 Tax=Parascedosporium putredinis TaxID=1442378 RepID=A0A9P1HDP1_9PEZI|nr:unnamed protein product [Parascedosporium putredinis]CAI8004521.1 unnamed protein product [Parascedosporium putredinis]
MAPQNPELHRESSRGISETQARHARHNGTLRRRLRLGYRGRSLRRNLCLRPALLPRDSQLIWRSSLILALICCYLMWAITYLAQLHPLVAPKRSDLRPEAISLASSQPPAPLLGTRSSDISPSSSSATRR